MAQIDAIHATRAVHRTMMHREDHPGSPAERDDLGARLHARPLLREHEFATREVVSWYREQEGGLQREDMLSIQILMQAVVITLAVVQEERGRPGLASAMAPFEKGRMRLRIVHIEA